MNCEDTETEVKHPLLDEIAALMSRYNVPADIHNDTLERLTAWILDE